MRSISNILSSPIAALISFSTLYSILPTHSSQSFTCVLFVHSFSPSSSLLSLSQLHQKSHHKNHRHHYPEENLNSPTLISSPSSSSYSLSTLYALKKSQTAIYDGSEFVSILSYLITEPNARIQFPNGNNDNEENKGTSTSTSDYTAQGGENIIQMQTNEMPSKKAGYMTFVAGTLPPTNKDRVVAVRALPPKTDQVTSSADKDIDSELTLLDDNVYVYTDSIAVIPKGVNDDDAISTASAALCGVHCGAMGIKSKNDHNDEDNDEDSNIGERKIKVRHSIFIHSCLFHK